MLDKQDLQAIKELIDSSVSASEERMKGYVDSSVTASEERMKARMDAGFSQVRQDAAILMESEFRPQFNLLAENQQLILEKLEALAPVSRVEALEADVDLLKSIVTNLVQDVSTLKKAQ